jgi:hypothetical protein
MTSHPNATARPRSLGTWLSAAAAVVGIAFVSGSAARATPPVVPIAVSLPGAQAGEFGSIKGRLLWGSDTAPEPKISQKQGQAEKDPTVCAKDAPIFDSELTVDPATRGVRYAFAYLVKPNGSNAAAVKELVEKTPKVVIDQTGCVFIPHAVAMHQDQELVLKSSDPVNHNVNVTPFVNQSFNILLPANGVLTKKLVAEKRVIPMKCDLHTWMKARIMVFDHPFFAVTEKDGSFEIKGVPAGAQNLVILHDSGYVTPRGASGMTVDVAAGKATDVGEVKLDPSKIKRK